MPARTKTSTTRLPQSLLEEIQKSDGNEHSQRQRSSKHQVSRKESRKQERAARKHKKAEFFSNHPKRQAEAEHTASPQRKRIKLDAGAGPSQPQLHSNSRPTVSNSSTQATLTVQKRTSEETKKEPKTKTSKTAVPKSGEIVQQRTRQEKEEDAYITYLESKLGYKKGKTSKRYNDGLDDLFDFASSLDFPSQKTTSVDFDEDEDPNIEDEEEDEIEDAEVMDDDGDFDESEVEGAGDSEEEGYSDEEWTGVHDSQDEDDSPPSPGSSDPNASSAAPATRYVPPHLRNKETQDSKNSETSLKLTRQLKGLLNRMSEQNIASIVDNIEEVYRNHRRHDVTSTLTTLIIDGICSHSSLLDSYVVLYAAFVSSLHKIVGIEFAAHFVQNVVASYEHHLSTLQEDPFVHSPSDATAGPISEDQGKEASNLVVLLSELYNFQVISCILVFDVIRGLLDGDMGEVKVELLLKIVKNSGQQLRQDDPSALKDIIQIVDTKHTGNETSLTSRARFMIETLHNLKNNKVKRLGAQNQAGDAVERMKKFLSGLSKKRHVLAHEPLRVSLDDLHSAESKGKWWLVGAAWGGDPLVDRQQETADVNTPVPEKSSEASASTALLKLARKQGMNTDIRRSIFVVLMSSDDYIDACERLSQLKLSEVQQREIIRVLLHCCGNEKVYNPFYTLVCQHLCSLSHSYKITLQYCLWDFLRDLGEKNVGGAEVIKNLKEGGGEDFHVKSFSSTRIRNVAKAYAWWIAKDCVGLAILKPIDFTLLKHQTQVFLNEFFIQLFLSSQTSSPLIGPGDNLPGTRNRAAVEEIFIKAARLQALSMGLVYFLSQNVLPETEGADTSIVKLVKWATEVAKETLRTGLDVVPNL